MSEPQQPAAAAHPHAAPAASAEASLIPSEGWHCSHLYYRFDRRELARLKPDERRAVSQAIAAALDPAGPEATARLQTSVVSGHKADFGVMLLDPDPLKIDAVHQRLMSGPAGAALQPTYSFVSLTEVSEYVPSVEQYGQRLVDQGEDPNGPAYQAKLKTYEAREVTMRKHRLTPELPPWPNFCFYPMNKKRKVGENWFLLPFDERNRMMGEHARSGMSFGGKVTQLITASTGFDDWEWGVTLWARNPEFLKEIVYKMRFDEASARYAEFGPFYVSYIMSPEEMLKHCRV